MMNTQKVLAFLEDKQREAMANHEDTFALGIAIEHINELLADNKEKSDIVEVQARKISNHEKTNAFKNKAITESYEYRRELESKLEAMEVMA